MILKYIPYGAYQVKTVNCHQLIQAPFIIILTDAGTVGRYWHEIWQKRIRTVSLNFSWLNDHSVIITRRLYTLISGIQACIPFRAIEELCSVCCRL